MKELLKTAFPLMAASLMAAVNQFVDRLFLGHDSDIAIQAITPAFILTVVFSCVFLSIVGYSGTFVAQYNGRQRHNQAVRALVQGLWLALAAIPIVFLILPIGNLVIERLGHAPALAFAEKTYFDIAFPSFALTSIATALGAYFTAVGRARIVGTAQILGCVVNMLLDCLLVPRLGIAGAAWSTVFAAATPCLIMGLEIGHRFRVLRAYSAPDWPLMKKIIIYSLPIAVHSFTGALTFFVFVWATGCVSPLALAVGNICFCVNGFYYTLTEGVGRGVSAIIGRHRGADDFRAVRTALRNAIALNLALFAVMAAVFFFLGGELTELFKSSESAFEPDVFRSTGVRLFRIMIVANICETLQLTFSAALQGVGDTRTVMKAMLFSEFLCWMPAIAIVLVCGGGISALWWTIALWRGLCTALLGRRWFTNGWRTIDLIGIPA